MKREGLAGATIPGRCWMASQQQSLGQANKGFPLTRTSIDCPGPHSNIKPGIFLTVYFKKKLRLSLLKNVFLGDKYVLDQPTSH